MTEESNVEKLKVKYKPLMKKYSLPDFKTLNENFEIGLVSEDTDLILKRVRKQMMEKVFGIIRTLETFLNPQNAPIFVFNIIKLFSQEDKERISKIYEQLSSYEVDSFGLEIEYSEDHEAELIKVISKDWVDVQKGLVLVYKAMGSKKESKKEDKGYFG